MGNQTRQRIVCFGEVLWDCLPAGLFLGGAPLNVAYHIARLGGSPAIISAVGSDFLGREARSRIEARGIDASAVTSLPSAPTGTVHAQISDTGDASYQFPDRVAWDEIEIGAPARRLLDEAEALVFGSLAMRSRSNRERFAAAADSCGARKLMDVNLRPPFRDRDAILALARRADVLKMNLAELGFLLGKDGIGTGSAESAVEALAGLGDGSWRICVTMGADGALFSDGASAVRARAEPADVADTIGSGDGFMAALTLKLLEGPITAEALEFCCEVGAFVATRSGAMPDYDPASLDEFIAARESASAAPPRS